MMKSAYLRGTMYIAAEMWVYNSGGSQIDLETIYTKVRAQVKGMAEIMEKLPKVRKHSQKNPEKYPIGKSSFISLLFVSVASH